MFGEIPVKEQIVSAGLPITPAIVIKHMQDTGTSWDIASALRLLGEIGTTEAVEAIPVLIKGVGSNHSSQSALKSLIHIAHTNPKADRATIFRAIADVLTHDIGIFVHPDKGNANVESAINLLLDDAGSEAYEALKKITSKDLMHSKGVVKTLARPGCDFAIPLIVNAEVDLKRIDGRDERAELLMKINTLASQAAIGQIVDDKNHYDVVSSVRYAKGDSSVACIALAYSDSTEAAPIGLAFLEKMDSEEIQKRIPSILAHFKDRLKGFESEINIYASRPAPSNDVKDENPKWDKSFNANNIATHVKNIYRGDAVLAIELLTKLSKLGFENAAQNLVKVARMSKEARPYALEKISEIGGAREASALLSHHSYGDENKVYLRSVLPTVLSIKEGGVSQLIETFKWHPELEQELFNNADKNNPDIFQAAIKLAGNYSHWRDAAIKAYLDAPDEAKSESLRITLQRSHPHKIIDAFAQVETEYAAQGILDVVKFYHWGQYSKQQESEIAHYAIQAVAGSRSSATAGLLAEIGLLRPSYQMPMLENLIERKKNADTPEEIQAICHAAKPLVKEIANPKVLYKALSRMKDEARESLSGVFDRIDAERIVPEAKAGYFSALYAGVVRNISTRHRQDKAHDKLFRTRDHN